MCSSDLFLAELPLKLVPPSHQGRWAVRWWHRLWWHSGRRLLHLPVLLLSLGRGRLEALRRSLGAFRRGRPMIRRSSGAL